MSIAAIDRVFKRCPEKGSEYLVLIALADQANDEGQNIWFKWDSLAHKARITTRTARIAVQDLLDSGRLTVEMGAAPRGYDLYHINFPPGLYTRDDFERDEEARKLNKRAAGKTSFGKKRDGSPVASAEAPDGASEDSSQPEPSSRSEESSRTSEEFSQKSEESSLGTLLPRPPSAAEVTPEPSLNRPLNRGVSNVEEDARGASERAQPSASMVALPSPPPHTTGDASLKDVKAVRDQPAGAAVLSPDGEAADAAITDTEWAFLNGPLAGPQESSQVESGEKVPGAAALALPAPPAARVELLRPVPRDELLERPAAMPSDTVYRLVKGLVGGNKAVEDGLLDTMTPAGALPRRDWLRLTEEELVVAREAAQAEAQAEKLNFYTCAIRALDVLIGAPVGQAGKRGAPVVAVVANAGCHAAARPQEQADRSSDLGKYEVGARWTRKADGLGVTVDRTELVKRRSTEGLVYHLSDGKTCNALQLMTGYEFGAVSA